MDPDATLRDLLAALEESDLETVTELVQALRTWIEKGGFPPVTLGSPVLGFDWHRKLTTFLCEACLERATQFSPHFSETGGTP